MKRCMNRDRAYPLSLVAVLFLAAVIATALVGHSHEHGADAGPTASAISIR